MGSRRTICRRWRRSSSTRWCGSTGAPSVRYRLLETVRQYALERLEDAGEADADPRSPSRRVPGPGRARSGREALTPRQPRGRSPRSTRRRRTSRRRSTRRSTTDPEQRRCALCLALEFWFRRERVSARPTTPTRARSTGVDPPPAAAGARAGRVGVDRGQRRRLRRARTRSRPTPRRTPSSAGTRARSPPRCSCSPTTASSRTRWTPWGCCSAAATCACTSRTSTCSARAEALLRGVAWFQQDARGCRVGFDELRLRLERLGDRETLAWFWFEQGAVRYPLGEHEDAAELLAPSRRRGGARSARRPPIAPPAPTSR